MLQPDGQPATPGRSAPDPGSRAEESSAPGSRPEESSPPGSHAEPAQSGRPQPVPVHLGQSAAGQRGFAPAQGSAAGQCHRDVRHHLRQSGQRSAVQSRPGGGGRSAVQSRPGGGGGRAVRVWPQRGAPPTGRVPGEPQSEPEEELEGRGGERGGAGGAGGAAVPERQPLASGSARGIGQGREVQAGVSRHSL